MKYKYDSRKNCASQMKREQFFSVSHFAIPLPTVNCQLSTVNWIHTFSAKEKDTETGLSYFGSRYYSSDLSIWLSVDPMSDKYPSLSPYTYCANNPVKLVDPNGEEIYEFDENGKYLGCSGPQGSADQIIIRKDNGDIEKSKEYANGTVTKDFERTITQKSTGEDVNVAFLKVKGDQNAKEIFEFVVGKTNVEWSKTAVGSEKKGINYLSNSQEKEHDSSVSIVLNMFSTIRSHIHSQPDSQNPSNDDCESARELEIKNGCKPVYTAIYHKGKYYEYNKCTCIIDKHIKDGVKQLFH